MTYLTYLANKQRPVKPIKYWQAEKNGIVVDANNSIALLRHKWGSGAIYKAVR